MAVSVTVETSRIYLSGSGTITLDAVNTAVGDTAVMERTGTDPYVYEIKGNRELEVRTGVELQCEEDDELQWNLSTNKSPLFDCQTGSTITVEPGFTFNFDTSNGNYARWYMYGDTSLQGTVAKPIIIKRYYENRIYPREGSSHDWDYVEIQDPSSYSTYNVALYFASDGGIAQTSSFTNIKVNNRTNSGYIVRFYPGDWSNFTFDNWDTTDTRYGVDSLGASFKFTNSTFRQIYYYNFVRGNFAGDSYVTSSNSTSPYINEQSKATFENCTFEDNYNASSGEMGFYISYSVVVKFKDCTFQGVEDTMSYGARAYYASKFLWEGTTTFTNVTTNRTWSTNGTHLHVYSLDLTVNDSGGSPLENAFVTIRQKEGKEIWHFKTDSNGQIKDCFGDNPVFVLKEETSTGIYTQWSDGSTDDKKHSITISHPDYQIDTRDVSFTEDKTIVAQLNDNLVGVTTIYDSTIYDSTIY